MTYIIKASRKEEKFINAYFETVAFTERDQRKYYTEQVRDRLQRKAEQFGEIDVYYEEVTE